MCVSTLKDASFLRGGCRGGSRTLRPNMPVSGHMSTFDAEQEQATYPANKNIARNKNAQAETAAANYPNGPQDGGRASFDAEQQQAVSSSDVSQKLTTPPRQGKSKKSKLLGQTKGSSSGGSGDSELLKRQKGGKLARFFCEDSRDLGVGQLAAISHARSRLIYGAQGRLIPEAMEDERDAVQPNQDLDGGDGDHEEGKNINSGWGNRAEDAQISEEIVLAALQKQFMILPNGKFRSNWDVAQAVLLIYIAVTLPWRLGFDQPTDLWSFWFVVDLVIDVYFWADLVLNFRTAVYTWEGALEHRPLMVAKMYARGVSAAPSFSVLYDAYRAVNCERCYGRMSPMLPASRSPLCSTILPLRWHCCSGFQSTSYLACRLDMLNISSRLSRLIWRTTKRFVCCA